MTTGIRYIVFPILCVSIYSAEAATAPVAPQPTPATPVAIIGEAPAVQEAPPAPDRPLMVIRFNASYVHYQNSLILAVTKAREANPGVRFKVVSYVPVGNSRLQNERIVQKAKSNQAVIAQQIRDLGIAPERVTTSAQSDESLANEEIHIFVN
jgi:hypothetical protein